jgi:hypothetical protein
MEANKTKTIMKKSFAIIGSGNIGPTVTDWTNKIVIDGNGIDASE